MRRISPASTQPVRKRGRPDPAESVEVLGKLYRVAYRHFIVNGVADASLLSIAREAGVSRQMIHNRFGNKQQFFETVLDLGNNHMQDRFSIAVMPQTTDPWIIFNFLGNEFCDIQLDPDTVEIFRVMNVATYRHHEIAGAHDAELKRAHAFIIKHLRAAGRALKVPITDAKGAARDFLALIEGFVQPALQGREARPSPQAQAKAINAIVRRYLRGLGFVEADK